ncbi:GHKL domain-containing protein [Blautia schinkii]|nr:GHKL domain-containing protein [Blautia schinkii]
MPLSFRLFSVGVSYICFGIGLYALASGILEKKIKALPCVIYTIYYLFANALILAGIFRVYVQVDAYEYEYVYVNVINLLNGTIGNLLHAIMLAFILRRFLGADFWQGLAAAFLGNFIAYTVNSVLMEVTSYYSPTFGGMYLYTFITIYIPHLAVLLAAAIVVPILRKSSFYRYFSHLFSGKLWAAGTLLFSFLLMCVWQVLDWLYPDTTPGIGYNIFFFALIVVALFWVQFLAMYAAGQDKIRAQEETIAQHQAHMALLEELQQEIRAFRHDFTNLFSGLTLQAQEGDLAGIQDFMRKTSSYFDEKLGQEIQQMDGLNNIRLYPLRSLLTTKLADMKKRGIHSVIEVLYPVDNKIVMETEDLLRGLGILVDNAMEAAPQTDGTVRIILLQEEKELYIAVSNNYDKEPELSTLSRKGYTTKGKGRGTGLASYRRIVSRCKGCVARTYLKDGYFMQELRLPVA